MTHVTTLPDQARKALRAAMNGCADEKTKIPALRGVLVRTTPRGMLEFTGTDLARVERAECGAKVEAALECVIAHPRDLAQWLALANKGAVTLSLEATEDGERLTLAQPHNVARFTTYSTRDYPMATATGAHTPAQPIPQPDRVTRWLPSTLEGDVRAERREHYGALHIRSATGARWDVVHTVTDGLVGQCKDKARAQRLAHYMARSGIDWDTAHIVTDDKKRERLEVDSASLAILSKINREHVETGLATPHPIAATVAQPAPAEPVKIAIARISHPAPAPTPAPAQPVKVQREARVPRAVSPVRLAEVAYNGRIYRDCEVEISGTRAQCLIGARAVNVPMSAVRWQ